MVKDTRTQRAVYFSDKEHQQITKEAEKKGLSFGVLVRMRALKKEL